MLNESPDNFLNNLHPLTSPGSIIDLQVLENGQIVALFRNWITLLTRNGRVLSSIKLQKRSISLGRFADAFVITCISKWLYFVRIVDDELNIFRRMRTKLQFTGACALDTESLMCVAHEEPTIYVYNGRGTCIRTIDLGSYGMDLPHRTSSRRIRQNLIGNVVVSDYYNNAVFILSENQQHSVTHCVNFPANIAACDKFVYIAQDGIEDCVLEIQLDDHSTTAVLEEEDGIIKPNCVFVNSNNVIMIEMQDTEPVARKYQIPYDVM